MRVKNKFTFQMAAEQYGSYSCQSALVLVRQAIPDRCSMLSKWVLFFNQGNLTSLFLMGIKKLLRVLLSETILMSIQKSCFLAAIKNGERVPKLQNYYRIR